MMRGNTSKLDSLITIFIFFLSLASLGFIRQDFVTHQLERVAQADSQITTASVSWPRSINEENDINSLNNDLSNWKIRSQFLIFRELTDKSRVSFILLGAKNYQDYLQGKSPQAPKTCNQKVCEVIALLPHGAKVPDLSNIGIKIIDQRTRAVHLPIPADFGVDTTLPILITPLVDQLSQWQPFRYLPATYGWQIAPKDSSNLSASLYRRDLIRLDTHLNTHFSNISVNYPIDDLDSLVEREHHATTIALNAAKTILVISILGLLLIYQRFRFTRVVSILSAIASSLLIAGLWGYLVLIQVAISLLSFALLFFILNRILQRKLVTRDLNTLALYRNSLARILSIALLIGLAVSVGISATQYVDRTKEIRKAIVDQNSPLDFNLKVGTALDRPLDLGSLDEIRALPGDNQLVAVVRGTATVVNNQGDERQVNLIAQSDGSLWQEPGLSLGSGRHLVFQTSGIAPAIDLIVWLKGANGSHFAVRTAGSKERRGVIPTEHSGANSIVAFELRESSANATKREHALGEAVGRAFDVLNGDGKILSITVDEQVIPFDRSWPISKFSYALLDKPLILRPQIAPFPLQIRLSDDIREGLSTLKIDDVISSSLTYQRDTNTFGIEKPFVVLNLAAYQALVAPSQPYALDPIEVWIKSKNTTTFEKAFKSSKFSSLKLISRQKLLTSQSKNSYWRTWQYLVYTGVGSILLMIMIALISLLMSWRKDKGEKNFEFTKYFATSPPSAKPLIFLALESALAAVPILYLSRLIAGLIA